MKRTYPDGPKIHFPLVAIARMLPSRFPFDSLAFGLENARQYGDILYYRVGPLRVYQLSHPNLVRQILVEQHEKFRKPWLLKRAFRPFAGEGLVTSDGALWKRQRKLMQPAFYHTQLAVYSEIIVELATRMADSFAEGGVCEMREEMARLTLSVVVKSLFGGDLPRDGEELGGAMLAILDAASHRVNAVLTLPSWVPTRRNLREKRAVAKLDSILQALIQERRTSGATRHDLLSTLLAAADEDSEARMSYQQLRDEMMTLFLAGHETTASALTWTWYLLSRHPEVEAKLLDELRSTLGGRAPTVTDLPKLPYTEMVIREAIRLYPPAPGVAREPIEDINIGGFEVPKGSLVTGNSYAMHHDARFFDDPERFNPERFAPGWEERIPRYAYLPFGAGPRVCIGNAFAMMEARLVLATIAQRVKLSLQSPDPIAPAQLVTVRPSKPVMMRLERRDSASATTPAPKP
jgi:cytochrome P450